MFSEWKHSEINLIEIGVLGGASLRLWRWFFEKATLVGIDINPDCRKLAGERTIIKIGSQEDPSFLQEIANEHPPTIVIDDGSHIAHHMITSFETLFPRLRPGGIYIFEDLSFHFEEGVGQWQGFKAHQGLSDKSIYEYLTRFSRARAANLNVPQGSWGFSRYAFEHIDSVLFLGGVIVIRKKAPRDLAGDIEIFEREILKRSDDSSKQRYANYLIINNIHQDRAYLLLKEVLKSNPNKIGALTDLFHASERLARLDEAADAVSQITKYDPFNEWAWRTLVETQQRRKRPDLELQALEGLLNISKGSVDLHVRLSALYENSGNLVAALAAVRAASDIAPEKRELSQRVAALATKLSKDK